MNLWPEERDHVRSKYPFLGWAGGQILPRNPEEEARLEKWRQELTVQSQDLARIRLEVETRREELQQLEENLSLEREQLKSEQNQ